MHRLLVTATVSLLALAAPASAAERYAAPAGSGSACTRASPCAVGLAIGDAANGDEVILASGEYGAPNGLTSTIFSEKDIVVRGASTTDKPRILVFNANPAIVLNGRVDVRDIEVRNLSPAPGATAVYAGSRNAVFTRVVVSTAGRTGPGDQAIALEMSAAATLQDSVVVATANNASPLAGGTALRLFDSGAPGAGTVRNVTLDTPTGSAGFALDANIVSSGQWLTTVANTIVGGQAQAKGAANRGIELAFVSSYLRSEPITGAGGTVTKTNVTTTAPVFVDAASRDFRQAPSSASTIDKGVASPTTLDVDGDQRTIGGRPDIGADEIPAVPTAVLTGTADVGATSATVLGSASGGGGAATWRLEYGVGDFASLVPQTFALPRSTATGPVGVGLTGLTTGAAYQARLVVTNDRAPPTSPPLAFAPGLASTPPPPTAAGPATAPVAAPTVQLLTTSAKARKGRVKVRLRNPGTTPVTVTVRLGTLASPATVTIRPGATVTVTLRLSRRAAARLKTAKGGRLRATLTATVGTTKVSGKLTLRRGA